MRFGNRLQGRSESSGSSSDTIPPGKYLVNITGIKEVSNDYGWSGANFEFTVQSGPHAKRKAWTTWTMTMNPNPDGKLKTQKDVDEFLEKQLAEVKGLLRSARHQNPDDPDSAPILGLSLVVRMIAQKKRDGSGMENKIVGWEDASKAPPAATQGQPQRAPGGMTFPGQPGGHQQAQYSQAPQGWQQPPQQYPPQAQPRQNLDDEIPF